MIKIKMLIAALLFGVSISSFAAFSYLNASGVPVLSIHFLQPATATSYVDLQVNGHDEGVQTFSGASNFMYVGNKGVAKGIKIGDLSLAQPNIFDFYVCTTADCISKTLAKQTAYNISIKQVASDSYTATPNLVGVTLK